MSVTYDFILDLVRTRCSAPCRLLDFGCGGGEVVGKALDAGFDAWGVDSFKDVWEQYAERASSIGHRIQHVAEGTPLPFADNWFDVVVSNQVMEHVADPGPVITEMARVLRPGGLLVAIFPTREILIEPHLKVPLVHWFSPGSASQTQMLRMMHRLGLGLGRNEDRAAWVSGASDSLQRHIFYRTQNEAISTFQQRFRLVARGDAAFMRDRLARSERMRKLAPLFAPRWMDPLLRMLCVRLANVVLVMQRV